MCIPVGDGGLRQLQAVALQEDELDVPETGRWKCLHYYVYFIDPDLGCAMCACPLGVGSGSRFTATGIATWPSS